MMDWEDMILRRQEEIELAEDCDGECERCLHLRREYGPYPWMEQIEYCVLPAHERR